MSLLYLGNDTTVSIDLIDVEGEVATGANVTATLYAGTAAVDGQEWPLSLAESPDGTYSGVLSSELELAEGQSLRLVISASHDGATAVWDHLFRAAVRRATLA